MTAGSLEIRPLTLADDIEAELDLQRRSFGPVSAASRASRVAGIEHGIRAGTMIGVFDGRQLVASARYHHMRQWWHGRSMPMAGVAGVKVAPEHRGRGTGTAMMAALLPELAGRGYPVSVLYPSTVPLYRAAGWELAGGRYEIVLPARSLGALVSPDPLLAPGDRTARAVSDAAGLRRAAPGDEAAVVDVIDRVHAALRHSGPTTREPAELAGWLADEDHFAYLADDGFLSYRWSRGTSEVEVGWLVAGSEATARAFWRILGSHATMADQVRAILAPDDPVSWLIRDPDAVLRCEDRWMLRLVDAPAAIAGRGYPASAGLSVELEIADQQLPANTGRWLLTIDGGAGKLDQTGPAGQRGDLLRLSSRGLAAMYAGIPLRTLRLAGLAAGSAGSDDALDGAFACSAFLIDDF